MQDNITTEGIAIDLGARRAVDAWTAEMYAAAAAREYRFAGLWAQVARSAVELTECECPNDCLHDHENE
jgi:hypothetical protein